MLQKIKETEKGFSLIEAMVATMVSAITFVGVYSMASYATITTKNSADRQRMQIIAEEMLETLSADIANIDNYNNMDFTTCTAPTGSQTADFYQNRYKWCQMLNDSVGLPATGDTRKITITTSGTSRIVHIVLMSRNNKAQIIINNIYE